MEHDLHMLRMTEHKARTKKGGMLVKEYRLPVIRGVSSWNLMDSIVIIVNNTALYT